LRQQGACDLDPLTPSNQVFTARLKTKRAREAIANSDSKAKVASQLLSAIR